MSTSISDNYRTLAAASSSMSIRDIWRTFGPEGTGPIVPAPGETVMDHYRKDVTATSVQSSRDTMLSHGFWVG